MRKFLTLLAMIAISASVFAQKEVTKFLGQQAYLHKKKLQSFWEYRSMAVPQK